MPLILKAAGNRIYLRGGNGQAKTQIYGVQNWTYTKERAETPDLFTFDFPEPCFANGGRYLPKLRDEIIIYRSEGDAVNDIRFFGGLLTQIDDKTQQLAGSRFSVHYTLQAQSFDILVDREIRQPQKADLSWEALLQFLLTTHFSGQLSTDFSFIDNPVSAPPIRINNGSIRTLLKAMRQLTNADYFVDAYKRLHVFQASDRPAGFTVTDTPANHRTVWESPPVLQSEGRAIYNIVRQPYQDQVDLNDWDGESFTAQGDPKGQGGQLPLLRTPASYQDSTYLEDRFDGTVFDASIWIEIDDTSTQHPDYPNHGYLFPAEGQAQVVGGTGILGDVGLISSNFFQAIEATYLIQEFQLTSSTGEGYIALFTDGDGLTPEHFKAGLHVNNGQLYALDGTLLIATLDLTVNYLLWVTLSADGWQYEILGGSYASKQVIYQQIDDHLSDYKIAPVISINLSASINSVRFRRSDRGVVLSINGQHKVVGLESSDTDLPDIDAFLNVDETPALLKFRAARNLALIASVTDNQHFTVASGQGSSLSSGQRLLIGDNIVDEFNGKEAYVQSISGDAITLRAPGLDSLSTSQQILIDTTLPAKGDKLLVRYGYVKGDEAVAYDQDSVDRYGPSPITLDEKDHIKRFDDAQSEADNYLSRYKDGLLTLQITSNDTLISIDPEPMTCVSVSLSKRADPIYRTLILQRVQITPQGGLGLRYDLQMESADPVRAIEDLFAQGRTLSIGSDGAIRLSVNLTPVSVSQSELSISSLSDAYITWANPMHRRWGEFKWFG
jgi:hypothetical protein